MATVHVAVAVLINPENQVLIAKRASNQHQGDKWEFPGGKVESNENSQEALCREIEEELGIEIESAEFLIDIIHQYDDKKVLLDIYRVNQWQGEPLGKEGQPILWVEKSTLHSYEFPEANAEIVSLLQS